MLWKNDEQQLGSTCFFSEGGTNNNDINININNNNNGILSSSFSEKFSKWLTESGGFELHVGLGDMLWGHATFARFLVTEQHMFLSKESNKLRESLLLLLLLFSPTLTAFLFSQSNQG